jgi:hypothetical protein
VDRPPARGIVTVKNDPIRTSSPAGYKVETD